MGALQSLVVVTITNSIDHYPEFLSETEKFPGLVRYVQTTGLETFVVDENDPSRWWLASEFILESGITKMLVDASELEA